MALHIVKATGVIMTKDGREVATATGRTVGKMVESGKMRYVVRYFMKHIQRINLHFLNHLVGVDEYEVDALGNSEHNLWEWK